MSGLAQMLYNCTRMVSVGVKGLILNYAVRRCSPPLRPRYPNKNVCSDRGESR